LYWQFSYFNNER